MNDSSIFNFNVRLLDVGNLYKLYYPNIHFLTFPTTSFFKNLTFIRKDNITYLQKNVFLSHIRFQSIPIKIDRTTSNS